MTIKHYCSLSVPVIPIDTITFTLVRTWCSLQCWSFFYISKKIIPHLETHTHMLQPSFRLKQSPYQVSMTLVKFRRSILTFNRVDPAAFCTTCHWSLTHRWLEVNHQMLIWFIIIYLFSIWIKIDCKYMLIWFNHDLVLFLRYAEMLRCF